MRSAPYEEIATGRMWGVFSIHDDGEPRALFGGEGSASDWIAWQVSLDEMDPKRVLAMRSDEYAILAIDEVSGWVWNDTSSPPEAP